MSTLYRKHRPKSFADVTNQDHVKTTIRNQISSGKTAHAYLFTGPRGIGKTTIARIIARAVNCTQQKEGEPCNQCDFCNEILNEQAMDIYEIDAASHTDVANVRENIIENIRFAPNLLKYKVFIIDEVHMLSNHAFNALLKTMEEPPDHALFILATTEIHKVPQTIISRCQRFDFKKIGLSALVARLQKIIALEEVEVDEQVLKEIARHADGCVRDAESLLSQVLALGEKKITQEIAALVIPSTNTQSVVELIERMADSDAKTAISLINQGVENGVDITKFGDDLIDIWRNILLVKVGGPNQFDISLSDDVQSRLQTVSNKVDQAKITYIIETLLEIKQKIRSEKIPQLGLELAVVKICVQPEKKNQAQNTSQQEMENLPTIEIESIPVPEEPVPTEKDEPTPIENPEPQVATSSNNPIPVISLDEVEKKWPDIFQKVKECNATLPFVMQSGKVGSVNGDEVEICFQYQLHADTINQEKNRLILEKAFEQVLDKKVFVRGKYVNQESDDTVSTLLEEFGGNTV